MLVSLWRAEGRWSNESIVEACVWRGVALIEKIIAIAIGWNVVRPLEIESEWFIGRKSERRSFRCEMKLISTYLQACCSGCFPSFAIPMFDTRGARRTATLIEPVVVTKATSRAILIDVEQQNHPIDIGRGGERLTCGYVKEDMSGIIADAHCVEIVTTCLVDVAPSTGHAIVIAVRGVVLVIEIHGFYIVPLCKVARD